MPDRAWDVPVHPATSCVARSVRRSVASNDGDGTLTVAGVRYEIPSAYRTLLRPTVRVARWDLSSVDLVDPRRGTHLATLLPVDRERNAERRRRALADPTPGATATPVPPAVGVAPLLRQLMAEYAATGLPPAYVPHDTTLRDEANPIDDEVTTETP